MKIAVVGSINIDQSVETDKDHGEYQRGHGELK